MRIVLGILAAALLLFLILLFLPSGESARSVRALPWEIETTADGGSRVLGLTLERSTLADARRMFQEEPKVELFRGDDGALSVEAFFEQVWLSGLKAKVVLNLAVAPEQMEALYHRGLRISKAASGSAQVKLAAEDLAMLELAPVDVITYMPHTRLDEALLVSRFGEPARRLTEEKEQMLHLLYPERGVDVARSAKGKVVIQYVAPRRFGELLTPLEAPPTAE